MTQPFDSRPVPISTTSVETRFMSRVYGWMTAGLLVSALVAWYAVVNPSIVMAIATNRLLYLGLIVGELGLVAWLSGLVGRMSAATAAGVFLFYSGLNGLTLSVITLVYTNESIASTFGVTAAMFAALSLYGFVTRRSLAGVGAFCMMGLFGLIVASLVNLFLHSSTLSLVLSFVGVIVFVGLTAWDTQRLKAMASAVDIDGEDGRRLAVVGALALYLDFVNLFLLMLRLFGRRR